MRLRRLRLRPLCSGETVQQRLAALLRARRYSAGGFVQGAYRGLVLVLVLPPGRAVRLFLGLRRRPDLSGARVARHRPTMRTPTLCTMHALSRARAKAVGANGRGEAAAGCRRMDGRLTLLGTQAEPTTRHRRGRPRQAGKTERAASKQAGLLLSGGRVRFGADFEPIPLRPPAPPTNRSL